MRLVVTGLGEEMEAFDSLPEPVRRSLADAPFSVSAVPTLTAWLLGWKPAAIVEKVEASGLELVRANPVSDLDYEGRPLALYSRNPRRVR